MPGFNQRGPSNQGPMTGRRMGICVQGATAGETAQPVEFGMGRGMGRRAGRGFGRGRGVSPQWGIPPVQPASTKAELAQRAEMLETELNAVKQALNNLSDY